MTIENDGPIKSRIPLHASLLSLCMSGLGHIYCGELVSGLVWASTGMLGGLISLALLANEHLALSWVPMALVQFSSAAHAWAAAKHSPKDYRLKSWNRWYVYLLLMFMCSVGGIGHSLVVREHYVEAFVISTRSMVPTIQPGDRILVNKTAYRFEDVKVGDVVVFANPEKPSLTFIKRVIALSGDEVQISGGNLTINGIIVPDRATATTPDFGPITVPQYNCCLLYTSPSPRDLSTSRMPSSA